MDSTKALIAGVGIITILGGGALLIPETTTPEEEHAKVLVDEATVIDVATKQAEYKDRNGTYLQVQEGSTLPEGELGTVIEKLGIDSPYRVDVYNSPQGDGYQIVAETPEGEVSFGFGPEAADRTYVRTKEKVLASSTTK